MLSSGYLSWLKGGFAGVMEQRDFGFRIWDMERHRAQGIGHRVETHRSEVRGQRDEVKGSKFKVPSFLTKLKIMFKLETLNFKL
jgi:hypothetical protein